MNVVFGTEEDTNSQLTDTNNIPPIIVLSSVVNSVTSVTEARIYFCLFPWTAFPHKLYMQRS